MHKTPTVITTYYYVYQKSEFTTLINAWLVTWSIYGLEEISKFVVWQWFHEA